MRMFKNPFVKKLLFFVLSILILVALLMSEELTSFVGVFEDMKLNYTFLFLCIISNILLYLIPAFRILKFFRYFFKKDIALTRLYFISIATNLTNWIVPLKAGGLITRPYLMKKHFDVKPEFTYFFSVIEYSLDILLQLIVLVLLLFYYPIGKGFLSSNSILLSVLFVAAILTFFILTFKVDMSEMTRKFYYLLPGFLRKFVPSKIKKRKAQIFSLFDSLKSTKKKKRKFLNILIISLTQIILLPLILYYAFLSVGVVINFLNAIFVYWISGFIGQISGIPGGWGARDVTILFLATTLSSISYPEAFVGLVAFRFFALSVLVLMYFVGILTHKLKWKR